LSDNRLPQIGRLAVDRGLITPEQLDAALAELEARRAAGSQLPLGEILVEQGFLTRVQLDVLLAAQGSPDRPKQPIEGFELIRKLGEGGMGATFLARQLSLQRLVALKVLRKNLARGGDFVERFQREARLAGKLNHENIVSALDVGESGGFHYLAMEYVEGRSVAQLIPDGGFLDEPRALGIALQVARALECAGRLGIVHRDVKPDNIMVSPEGKVKLCDFGLAKQADSDLSLTQTGTMMGTPHYVSPEQARGETTIDGRCDIYSLGATLFRMVTGQTPYSGPTPAVVMMKHISDPVPWAKDANPAVSENCARLIARMMGKKPEERYPDATALIADLELVLAGRAPKLAPPRAAAAAGTAGAPATRPRGTGAYRPVAGRRPSTRLGTGITDSTKAIPTRSRGGLLRVGLAVAALALLLLGGWLVGRSMRRPVETGPGPTAVTPPVQPVPPPPPPKEGPSFEEQYKAAEQWWRDHPGSYDEAIAGFRRIGGRPGAGVWGLKAEDTCAEIAKARDAAVDAELSGIRERAGKLAAAGDYDAALAELDRRPARLADLLGPKLRAEGDALRRGAEDRLRAALGAAEKLSRDGEPQRALAELDKVAGVKYAAWAPRLAALRARLSEELKNVAELERKRKLADAGRQRDALLEAFDVQALAGRNREAAALVAAERARIPADLGALVAADLRALDGVARELANRDSAREAALKALIGKEVALRTRGDIVHNATIRTVAADAFEVERWYSVGGERKKTEYRIAFAELAPGELARLLPEPEPATADGFVAQAIAALAKGDAAVAGRALESAGAHPMAGRYAARVDALRLGAVEGAAKAAWDQSVAPLGKAAKPSAAEGKALLAALEAFAKAHGSTKFAAAQRAEIDRLQALALTALAGSPEGMQGRVQALFRGRLVRFDPQTLAAELAYDFQDPRQAEDWPVTGTAQAQVEKGQLRVTLNQGWRADRVEHRAMWDSRGLEVRFGVGCDRLPNQAGANVYFVTAGYDGSVAAMLRAEGAGAWVVGASRAQIAESGSKITEGAAAAMVYTLANGRLTVTMNGQPALNGQLPAGYVYPAVRPAMGGTGTVRRVENLRITGTLDRAWLDAALKAAPAGPAPAPVPGQSPWQGAWQKMNGRSPMAGHCAVAFDTKRGWYVAASRDFAVQAFSAAADRWDQLSKPFRGDGETFPLDNGNVPGGLTYLPGKDALLFIGAQNSGEKGRGASCLFAMEPRTWSLYSPLNEHAEALAVVGGLVYKYNGHTMEVLDFERKTWSGFPGKVAPPERNCPGQIAAHVPPLKAIVLFGGPIYGAKGFDDTWAFDLTTGTWGEIRPQARPPAVLSHSVCYDPGNELFVAHGGRHVTDTWVYDAKRNSWFEVQVPARPSEGLGWIQYDTINKLCLAWSNSTGEIWALRIGPR